MTGGGKTCATRRVPRDGWHETGENRGATFVDMSADQSETTSNADRTEEVRAAYRRYVELREQVHAGTTSWSTIAEQCFTPDVVFVDPAWGRTEGRDAVATFMDESMAGLDDWTFPEDWTMVDGDRVVSFWWNRLPGTRPDGSPNQAPGVSILHYAGGGRFDHELDILNLAEVMELIAQSGWRPTGPMNAPPDHPDRNTEPPG